VLDSAFTSFEKKDGKVVVSFKRLSNGEARDDVECDFLIGADGLKSPVRAKLLGETEPRYTGRTIYRGLTKIDAVHGDGNTVSLCGDEISNFICYPVSESMGKEGKWHCNWGFNATRPHPGGQESWTHLAKIEDIREELAGMDGNVFGGVTPLQIAEKTEKIIGWALFDRDPLTTFDYGNITLLGDSAHPMLPFGSQGATQAIMDAEAIGTAYALAMEAGEGIEGCVKRYSDMRCEVSGKVVVANRDMGSTRVLKVANERTKGMSKEEREAWCKDNGESMHDEVIQAYRASMPKSVRCKK
jgi:2-polyprenyl-6-methoxyphenol hydroxylase-like FAD-dependent oxidoreductase